MNLGNTLMIAKSQYSMANTFIPGKLLQSLNPTTKNHNPFFTNNQITQGNIKTPTIKGGYQFDQSHDYDAI
eukprot:Pgem_evm1s18970